ncbi:MAG: WYL domain-containing protein [Opitutaceae bacterium]|nr:WYL domain-containing protein [Opitutaceae bacterium]
MNRRGFLRATCGWLLGLSGLARLLATPKPAMEDQLRQALGEQRVVSFRYHGHARRVEPHALGRVTEGRLALLGWQVAGGSASEPPPGWRTFVLAEITGFKLTRKVFTPRADYKAAASGLKPIEAEVAGDKTR